jgi:hypothetical protein
MSYEEEFDKIVRQKAGQADYPFDENNWMKTRQILDEQRAVSQKAFLKNWIMPVAAVIAVGAVGVLLLNSGSGKTTRENFHAVSQIEHSSLNASITNSQNNAEVSSLPGKSAKSLTNFQTAPTTENNKNLLAQKTDILEQNAIVPSAPEGSSQISVTTPIALQKEVPAKADQEINVSSSVPVNIISVPETKSPELSSNGVIENVPHVSGNEVVPAQNDITEEPVISANESASSSGIAEDNLTSEEDITADKLDAKSLLLNIEQFSAEPSLPFVLLNRYDEDYFTKKKLTHYMNVEFGGTYLLGWNTANGADGKGLNWYGGVNYGYYLCPKTSISVGAQAYNITNIQQAFYKSSKKEYGFGSTSSYTAITTDNLYFISLPVKINYHVNSSNHFGIGLNTGYLLMAHSRIDKFQGTSEIGVTPVSTGNDKIYNGTANVNLMGSVFYSTKINPRLAVNVEFIYGFTDIFADNSNVSRAEKPMGVRLGINYYLFNK